MAAQSMYFGGLCWKEVYDVQALIGTFATFAAYVELGNDTRAWGITDTPPELLSS